MIIVGRVATTAALPYDTTNHQQETTTVIVSCTSRKLQASRMQYLCFQAKLGAEETKIDAMLRMGIDCQQATRLVLESSSILD